MDFVDIELGKFEEEVPTASLAETSFEAVGGNEVLEAVLVGHLPEVDGAQILQHGLDVLHYPVSQGPLLVEGQQEVNFAVGG